MRLRDTCTIQRGTAGTDPYTGEPSGALDWTSPTETTGVPCEIQPGSSSEANQDQEQVTAAWVAYLPAGTDITHADRVAWRGLTLTVDGEIGTWVRAGRVHHLEVPLKRQS